MSYQLKIFCKNLNRYIDINGGETLLDILADIGPELGFEPVVANVNNRTEDLSFPVFSPKHVEFLGAGTSAGRSAVVRSLCMMLYKAATDVVPGARLRFEHSISNGYYCCLHGAGLPEHGPEENTMEAIRTRMRQLAEENHEFIRKERLTAHAIDIFRKQGLDDKVMLLEGSTELYTVYYRLDGICDTYLGPLVPSTGALRVFNLIKYEDGMLLLGPDPENSAVPAKPVAQPKLFNAFTDYLRFNKIVDVADVAQLNKAVKDRQTARVINVAEAMHNKYMALISDRIARINADGGARIVLIAGPSSSGKTTSTKRLAIQLMTNLIVPKMISLDDYFVDRDKTPLDADGDYDYENLHALDLERLNTDLEALLKGKQINLPTYSFELGKRIEREKPLKLGPHDVLLMEGIHGLNPELVSGIDPDATFKMYVSALTTLNIDDHNWISTTDNRLLRRIVRDHKYRHTSALETIRRWPSVRRGETKWIFPFQENADAMFNSSLIFELGVMKDYVMPLLRDVPRNMPEYAKAVELMRLLDTFDSIPADLLPSTSVLREFLGGSSFHY